MTSSPSGPKDLSSSSRILSGLVVVFLLVLAWMAPVLSGWLEGLDLKLQDRLSRYAPAKERDDLVFLGVDEKSLSLSTLSDEQVAAHPVLPLLKERFPWDRKVYAAAIEALADAGVRLIILDFVFAEPSDESDGVLAATIAKHRDKVILAAAFSPVPDGGGDQLVFVEPLPDFLGPIDGGTRFGYINLWTNPDDGIARDFDYQRTLREVNGEEAHFDEVPFESLAGAVGLMLGKELPKGIVTPRFSSFDAYPAESFFELFTEDPSRFRDQVVIIGPAAARFQDMHTTSAGFLTGPQVHLHVLGALLEDSFFKRLDSPWWRLAFLLLGVFLAALLVRFVQRPLHLLVAGALLLVGLIIAAVVAAKLGWLVPVWASLTGAMGILVLALALSAIADRLRRDQMRRHLQRSLSPQVADAIIASPEGYLDAAQGGKKTVAVLFSDIRDFTSISESLDPTEVVGQLNEYFTEMTAAVFEHGGTIDKFIGDAVMAAWGGIDDLPPRESARSAVAAGMEMLERLAKLNEKWQSEGRLAFDVGIGIHLGEAVAGEVGSEVRSDFTVLGDAVNVASRIEGYTKEAGVPFLFSEEVNRHLEISGKSLGSFQLKGRVSETALFYP